MNLSSSAVTAVSDVVTVEVKLHTKEAKVLIWEMGHLGQQLNYHGLYKGERRHSDSYVRKCSNSCLSLL